MPTKHTQPKQHKRRQRHAFRFKIEPGGKIITSWARVIKAKTHVYVPLKAEHVRESMASKGVGNTQTCSMAVCASRERHCFPHKVEGYIDWFYNVAFIVSRIDKNNLPSECYVYAHSDGIGKLNDSPGGQQKLLKQLEAEGGERMIHLRPPRNQVNPPGKKIGKRDGTRTETKIVPRGAKWRFAVAQAGGVPQD